MYLKLEKIAIIMLMMLSFTTQTMLAQDEKQITGSDLTGDYVATGTRNGNINFSIEMDNDISGTMTVVKKGRTFTFNIAVTYVENGTIYFTSDGVGSMNWYNPNVEWGQWTSPLTGGSGNILPASSDK